MCLIGLLFPFTTKSKSRGHRSSGSGHRSSGHHSSGHHISGHKSSGHHSSGHHNPSHRSSGHSSSSHKSSGYHSSSHKSSSHRPSSGHSHRRRSSHSSHSHREKDAAASRSSTAAAEDALARLCISIEQSLHDEQRRWREQDRLNLAERYRLDLEHPLPSEKAPPYTLVDENNNIGPPYPCTPVTSAAPNPTMTTTPPVTDQTACRPIHAEGDRRSYERCCRGCVCLRCGSAIVTCGLPPLSVGGVLPPELEDTDVTAGGRRRARSVVEMGGEARRRRV
ncbi:hypothetical protein C8A05DRAFT_37093 [Staphylotrichum tortipilum]|uniref:Uncharacterized protein n=1 Tax=Staphylotrichum tortipilum TaxID=2831512 RepID=A0AAN6RQQ0_9PEZI|nr:hypothetical protein C8A05DRAFT_37093 [Staphylotrichum longicolle]